MEGHDNITPVYTEAELQSRLKEKAQDNNEYATKKSVSQNQLNVSSIMYLFSLFLAVFSAGKDPATGYYRSSQIALISLICLSVSIQFLIFILVTILANSKTEKLSNTRGCNCTAPSVNNLVTTLSGLLLIVTTAITSVSSYARVQGIFPTNSSAI